LFFLQASSWQGTYDPDTERQKQMLKEDIKPLTAYLKKYCSTYTVSKLLVCYLANKDHYLFITGNIEIAM
jgi:hypothetical protein